jgi:hypothetical protein
MSRLSTNWLLIAVFCGCLTGLVGCQPPETPEPPPSGSGPETFRVEPQ